MPTARSRSRCLAIPELGTCATSLRENRSTIRPPSITATLLQIAFTAAISWVTRTMVMPNRSLSCRRKAKILAVIWGSTDEVGSSQSRTFGLLASARAMATRCFCPPLNWPLIGVCLVRKAHDIEAFPTLLEPSAFFDAR